MRLKPGDIIHYEKHLAVGLLIEPLEKAGEIYWRYALRSPPRHDLSNIIVTIRVDKESLFLDGIEEGRLEYYEGRNAS